MVQGEQGFRRRDVPEGLEEIDSQHEASPTLRMPAVLRGPARAPPGNRPSPAPRATALYPPVASIRLSKRQGGVRARRPGAPIVLRALVVLLGLCTAAAAGGFVALVERPSFFAGIRNVATSPPKRPAVSPAKRPRARISSPSSSAAGGLVISALEPSNGSSGSTITISGSHLFAPDGYIVATFDGSPVPTSCPSQSECLALVPPAMPGTTTATVRLRTHSGTSNGLTFYYH